MSIQYPSFLHTAPRSPHVTCFQSYSGSWEPSDCGADRESAGNVLWLDWERSYFRLHATRARVLAPLSLAARCQIVKQLLALYTEFYIETTIRKYSVFFYPSDKVSVHSIQSWIKYIVFAVLVFTFKWSRGARASSDGHLKVSVYFRILPLSLRKSRGFEFQWATLHIVAHYVSGLISGVL